MSRRSRLLRAIVLELLSIDDGPGFTSCAELARELGIAEPEVEQAVRELHADGLVNIDGEQISASRAAQRMDELGLIGI